MRSILTGLRIGFAMLTVILLIPIVYVGRKICGEPEEGAEYEKF